MPGRSIVGLKYQKAHEWDGIQGGAGPRLGLGVEVIVSARFLRWEEGFLLPSERVVLVNIAPPIVRAGITRIRSRPGASCLRAGSANRAKSMEKNRPCPKPDQHLVHESCMSNDETFLQPTETGGATRSTYAFYEWWKKSKTGGYSQTNVRVLRNPPARRKLFLV